jgi:hypothetical protein
MKPAQFLIANAQLIAALASANGPRPPQLTGDALHDQSLFDVWMAAVALLAQGQEPGCHNGGTFLARVAAAKSLVSADQGEANPESRMIRHKTLPVEAPEEFWIAMKWSVYSNVDTAGGRAFDNSGEADKLLAIAVTKGMHGADALAYAVEEIDRQHEVSALTRAMRTDSSAVSKLADAMKTEAEETVLSRIMSRLSERTQYAIRQQLKGG